MADVTHLIAVRVVRVRVGVGLGAKLCFGLAIERAALGLVVDETLE
jgi:hypothetical protein